jgi:hypothetical protein
MSGDELIHGPDLERVDPPAYVERLERENAELRHALTMIQFGVPHRSKAWAQAQAALTGEPVLPWRAQPSILEVVVAFLRRQKGRKR